MDRGYFVYHANIDDSDGLMVHFDVGLSLPWGG